MASLNFSVYKDTDKNLVTKHYFSDLHLDVVNDVIVKADGTKNRDIQLDFDSLAIQNSLANIMLTHPGEKFLSPLFGCNLYKYLFEQVSEAIGQQIGSTIKKAIEDFEPRVTLSNIVVYAVMDTNEYVIEMQVGIPLLSKNFSLVKKLKALDSHQL